MSSDSRDTQPEIQIFELDGPTFMHPDESKTLGEQLVECLDDDMLPAPETDCAEAFGLVDPVFGLDVVVRRFGAYQFAWRHEAARAADFTAAANNGDQLTAIVNRPSKINGRPNPAGHGLGIDTFADFDKPQPGEIVDAEFPDEPRGGELVLEAEAVVRATSTDGADASPVAEAVRTMARIWANAIGVDPASAVDVNTLERRTRDIVQAAERQRETLHRIRRQADGLGSTLQLLGAEFCDTVRDQS